MNSLELNDKKANLKKRAFEIIDNCKMEIRDFTSAESNEIDSIKKQIEQVNIELRELENTLTIKQINTNLNTNKTMEFKLIKAINDIANNRGLDVTAKAVVNKGVEEMRKGGVSYGGQIQIPVNELRADITVETEGEDVVATEMYDILEPLRARNVLVQAGAKFLTGLVGDVQVPIMNGCNVSWEGEVAEAKDGATTFDNVKLQPKRLTAFVDISKQFLVQDSKSAEAMIRMDLVNAINSKLEATILGDGVGSTTIPAGIFAGEEIATVADFKGITNLEAQVEDANVIGDCAYIMSNKAKAILRNMPKSTKSTELVMQNGMVDGTQVYNTSNVAGTNIAYGDFSQLAIGQWGAIDLTVDPFTKSAEGKVRLVVNAYFDAKLLRDGAIAVAKA